MKFRLPRKRRHRVVIYIVCTGLILYAADLLWIRAWRHISVSPQTTYITAPLNAQGMPDYVKFVDERARQGVTPENNAAIPYLEVINNVIGPRVWDETFRRLSMPAPVEKRRVKDAYSFLPDQQPSYEVSQAFQAELELVRTQPWSAADHPIVAQWIAGNEVPLSALPKITARSRWYIPLITPPGGSILYAEMMHSFGARGLTQVAIARAMLYAHEGKFPEAEADLLACHRLARLSAQGATMSEFLTGIGSDRLVLDADIALARLLPRQELNAFIARFDALPPRPAARDAWETERFYMLDLLIYVAAHYREVETDPDGAYRSMLYTSRADDGRVGGFTKSAIERHRPAHFNAAMRLANDVIDEYVAIDAMPSVVARRAALRNVAKKLRDMEMNNQNPWADPALRLTVLSLRSGKVAFIQDEHAERVSLARVAFALAAYHAAAGSYPETLAALAPTYIASVPVDLFTEQPLHYKPQANGYVLYSVGDNEADDGGLAQSSLHHRADDIAVSVGGEVPPATRP